MSTQQLYKWMRRLGLASIADRCRYFFSYAKNYVANNAFKKQHPGFAFPPPYFIYETYHLNYKNYYEDGKQTATELAALIHQHYKTDNKISVLDWGCGPGRVVRHLPALLNADVFGSDYNAFYINWCSKNSKDVAFIKNELLPPINLPAGSIDVIYSLSIFTHLSAQNHKIWMSELLRLLKPGGILIITTQGDAFTEKLLPQELATYEKGELVVRSFAKEGHRLFSAFQPQAYMNTLFGTNNTLEFIPGNTNRSLHGAQDTWVVKKATA